MHAGEHACGRACIHGCRDEAGSSGRSTMDDFELAVHEEVLVPLGPALRPNTLKARRRDEVSRKTRPTGRAQRRQHQQGSRHQEMCTC